ncbi:MAG: hypothetical protein ABEJ24_01695 [Candidatus Magasanikbacteria bacterium]
MDYRKHPERFLKHLLAAPFIYLMIIPLVILDLFLELYHRVCFPLYGFEYVDRSKYIKIDRHRLSYLSGLEKINCAYCGYANGLLHYASVVAGETERYWCGIKHKQKEGFQEPSHHQDFLPYGNEEELKKLTEHQE